MLNRVCPCGLGRLGQIICGFKKWMRITAFGNAVFEIMLQWVDASFRDIGIDLKIPTGAEKRARIASFGSAAQDVVFQRINSFASYIGIASAIPGGLKK